MTMMLWSTPTGYHHCEPLLMGWIAGASFQQHNKQTTKMKSKLEKIMEMTEMKTVKTMKTATTNDGDNNNNYQQQK